MGSTNGSMKQEAAQQRTAPAADDTWTQDRKKGRSANPDGSDGSMGSARRAAGQDSWVDAVATLLATVVFGLGWVLVELERADPPLNRYDAAASEMWVAAVSTSIHARAIHARAAEAPAVAAVVEAAVEGTAEGAPAGKQGGEDARWTGLAQQRSSR